MVDRLVNSEANARRIANVEQCFGTSGQRLGIPGRVLVGEGVLTKICRKKPKPRQFFLFNDALVYGNIMIHKKKYNKQNIIPLENIKLENVVDNGNLRNGWKLKSPSKSFVVYAATATEKKEWMAHINKCVNDRQSLIGVNPNSTTDSPVWVPDSDAKICMHCHKSEFTVVNRRHHCRHCGIVACNACTSKKWLLPQQSSKRMRVCLTCYQQLAAEAPQGGKASPYDAIVTDERDSSGDDSSDDDDDPAPEGDSQLAIDDVSRPGSADDLSEIQSPDVEDSVVMWEPTPEPRPEPRPRSGQSNIMQQTRQSSSKHKYCDDELYTIACQKDC